MKFKQIYSKWSPTTKIIIGLTIILAVIGIIFTIFGEDINDFIKGNEGIKINPSEIYYNCSHNTGIIKTIIITNYEKTSKEDFTLTITSSINKDLSVNLIDLDNSIRSSIYSIRFSDEKNYYDFYSIASIKPKESIQFDIKLLSNNCSKDFTIYINKDTIASSERIFT